MIINNLEHEEVKEVTVYICSICKASFNDNDEVVLHMVNNHQNEEKIEEILNKIPGVPQIIRGSKTKRKFQRTIKEYQCRNCNYRTVHYSTYKRHLLIHQKINNNKCSHCSFATKQKSNLVRHLRDVHLNGTVDLEPIILLKNAEKRNVIDTNTHNVIMILTNEFENNHNK